MNDRGNSIGSGHTNSGNSFANGMSSPAWQRRLYGWVRDINAWDFMEPGCTG